MHVPLRSCVAKLLQDNKEETREKIGEELIGDKFCIPRTVL